MRKTEPLTGKIPLDTALAQARANRFGRMLPRGQENRIEPECWPALRPSFGFTREQGFFVIGSCFAHNLGRRLIADGYRVLYGEVEDGLQRNRYTPAAIWQELDWANRIFCRDDQVGEADIMPLLLEVAPGRWADLWSRPDHAGALPLEAAIAHRRALYSYFRGAFVADVAIITLGLIEAWHDAVTGTWVDFDTAWARRSDRERFSFVRMSFAAAKDYVERTVNLLADGKRKVLLTTSPVVLGRTFTEDDILVANSHSKAVLRAVAGEVSAAHPNVDYFPSYEIAMLTRRPEVWEDDLIHINPAFVARIMQHVTAAYVPGDAERQARDLLQFANLVEGLQFDAAEALRAAHADSVSASGDPAVQIAALRLHVARGEIAAAMPYARKLAQAEDEALVASRPDWVFDAARALSASPDAADASAGAALLARFAQRGAEQPPRLHYTFVRMERLRDATGLAQLVRIAEPLAWLPPLFASQIAGWLVAQGELGRAHALIVRHLAASPEERTLLESGVRISLAHGDLAATCTALEAMVRIDPRDVWAGMTLARTLVKRRLHDDALAALGALGRAVPDHPPALALTAHLLWTTRRRDEAVSMAERAMALGGDDPVVVRQVSRILAARAL
ncbi:GSCFA domain-containing protein [Novosphingobium sp.]|uniref:GSCFA domain-containing protein n=1 Tax=Novosphingobium sp. TaxID=1874826 RepID=UPI00261C80E4|nr:GSCFA domain-containing protein [Novosphingobium sp.]